ncbi:MAG: hypothetical protein C4527_11240 [Candidatus Omnitrophota bacterium]|jgi:hypothetical protein|nr:MAG: hypothetical protein C4527_11240 [Candidatus Omnitrophota bacterium]
MVTAQEIQPALPGDPFFEGHADIYDAIENYGPLGSASYDPSTKTYEISGAGIDIWNNFDQFHFLFKQISGDFTLTARMEHDVSERSTSTDAWIKGMLMARQNLTAGSPNFGNRIRRDGQYSWQMRTAQDGASTSDGSNRLVLSDWGYFANEWPPVKIEKIGNQWSIYVQDTLGDNQWVQIQSTQTLTLEDPFYVGLAVTSHLVNTIQFTWFREVELDFDETDVENWMIVE